MPTVLLCTSDVDAQARAFADAARRAQLDLVVVTERVGDLDAPWRAGAIEAQFDADPAVARAVLQAVQRTDIVAVLAVGEAPTCLVAHLNEGLGLPGHTPDAVALVQDRLRLRGRMVAAGLPVPWFVTIPARGDEDLDRLARVRFPCVLKAVAPGRHVTIRADSLAELMAARDTLASVGGSRGQDEGDSAPDTLLVEGCVAGDAFVLDGVLEQGALRVFALFERIAVAQRAMHLATIHVTPARVAPERQRAMAGHIARAARAAGLHHGPVHADCRVTGEDVVVIGLSPRAADASCARAIPVVAPDRTRITFEDAVLAHALGAPLDGYGHQAIASAVLTIHAPAGHVRGLDVVRAMPWVTGAEARPGRGTGYEHDGVALVWAEGPQPADAIDTLREAAARLQMAAEGGESTSTV